MGLIYGCCFMGLNGDCYVLSFDWYSKYFESPWYNVDFIHKQKETHKRISITYSFSVFGLALSLEHFVCSWAQKINVRNVIVDFFARQMSRKFQRFWKPVDWLCSPYYIILPQSHDFTFILYLKASRSSIVHLTLCSWHVCHRYLILAYLSILKCICPLHKSHTNIDFNF